jgi:hypothetical protein
LIFDQAIAQLIWSIGYEADPRAVAPLAAIAPRPHLLVRLHATRDTVLRRMDQREGEQSLLERDMPGDSSAIERATAAMHAVADATRDWIHVEVTHDDDAAAGACVDAITAVIQRQRQEAAR